MFSRLKTYLAKALNWILSGADSDFFRGKGAEINGDGRKSEAVAGAVVLDEVGRG
jgi:hypothetical protein